MLAPGRFILLFSPNNNYKIIYLKQIKNVKDNLIICVLHVFNINSIMINIYYLLYENNIFKPDLRMVFKMI